MSLFRNGIGHIIDRMALFNINRPTKPTYIFGSNFICVEEKILPNFDGIQLAMHNNESLTMTYVKEPKLTADIQFYENNIRTVKHARSNYYSNESIKLLVFHGVPLAPRLHDIAIPDVDFNRWVYLYFKNRDTHGSDFIVRQRCMEECLFTLDIVMYRTGFVYPAVYKFIRKYINEAITFEEEDRHFGYIHSGGYTNKQIEYSLNQLGLQIQRFKKPGEEKWICSQLVNNIVSTRKFHFTVKDKIDLPPEIVKRRKYSSVYIKGKNKV